MKPLILATLFIVLMGCKKQEITVQVQVGHYYRLKSNVFSKGQYQPENPVRADSLYIDPLSHKPYAKIWARIDWNNFDRKQQANQIRIGRGLVVGDTTHIKWECPQGDLE